MSKFNYGETKGLIRMLDDLADRLEDEGRGKDLVRLREYLVEFFADYAKQVEREEVLKKAYGFYSVRNKKGKKVRVTIPEED